MFPSFRTDWPLSSPKASRHTRRVARALAQLPAEPIQEPTEQHCLRCHMTFYTGGDEACATECVVPHVYREGPIYLMGGDFTYVSDCCGESATIRELGMGTGNFEVSSIEPCFVGTHAIYGFDVKYNDVNVVKCIKDSMGRCRREVLPQQDGEPLFLKIEEGSSSTSSISEDGHSVESEGSVGQRIEKVKRRRIRK
ncbi:hypothetical protein BDW22DRAFT_1349703 [Trametopsis cervina]|nr:hypothetical protein BDW22DRAFT_1349703 [Trametopsis cervina]